MLWRSSNYAICLQEEQANKTCLGRKIKNKMKKPEEESEEVEEQVEDDEVEDDEE